MGPSDEAFKAAGTIAESLKTQPLALALVLVNVLFLVGGIYVLREASNGMREDRKAQMVLMEKILACREQPR